MTAKLLGAVAAILLVACKDGPTAPPTGNLKVSIVTVGGDFDQDGYTLVASGQPRPVSPTEIVLLDNIDAGTYVLRLAGIADNCTLAGDPERSVMVPSGGTAEVEFAVTCDVTGIEITTHTTGPDQPIGGYVVEAGERVNPIPTNGTLLLGRVTPGDHTLSIRPIANCSVAGGNVAIIKVTNRTVTRVTFEVTCQPFDKPIAFQRDTVIRGVFESAILRTTVDGAAPERVGAGSTPAWSPDGKKLAYSNVFCDFYYGLPCTGGLVILDMETGQESVPAYGKLGIEPSWSPDGQHIAFIKVGPFADYPGVLYVSAIDGSSPVAITAPGLREHHPSWSPDGQRIAFQCFKAPGSSEICAVNRDGSGYVQLTNVGGYNGWPAWSPDGGRIAFVTDRYSGQSSVAMMSPDGKSVTQLTNGWEPAWSPDGSKLVFARTDGVYTIGSDGSNATRLTRGPHHAPTWRK